MLDAILVMFKTKAYVYKNYTNENYILTTKNEPQKYSDEFNYSCKVNLCFQEQHIKFQLDLYTYPWYGCPISLVYFCFPSWCIKMGKTYDLIFKF